jgi:hypothetical protein
MSFTPAEVQTLTASIGAVASVSVVVTGGLTAYFAGRRDRRRTLYGEAVKAALGWHEMLYRVRRRTTENSPQLVAMFHELQEMLTYYQGWIGSESAVLERSYNRFVKDVKRATEAEIQKAWAEPIRPVPGNARGEDTHPDVSDFAASFLADVRDHLSPWPWRRWALRNRAKGMT